MKTWSRLVGSILLVCATLAFAVASQPVDLIKDTAQKTFAAIEQNRATIKSGVIRALWLAAIVKDCVDRPRGCPGHHAAAIEKTPYGAYASGCRPGIPRHAR